MFNISTSIHAGDEMYLTALAKITSSGLAKAVYLRQGADINATIQQLLNWRFGRKDTIKFLDFASGYGRSTRFLVQDVPPSNVWVSDIYADAVTFQKETFKVNGFVSCHNPSSLYCDEKFDMIFVASLFTHLPQERFMNWLRRLFEMLAPRGVLVFSLHDEALAGGREIPPPGILFLEASESRTLSKKEYGETYVTEGFVQLAINTITSSSWPYRRLVRALCGAQDVYIVPKNSDETFRDFHYVQPPVGYVDWFKISETGELRIGGWAGNPNDGVGLEAVGVSIGGSTIMSCKPDLPRPDVAKVLGNEKYFNSGWECVHSVSGLNLDGMIEVVAISEGGLSALLHFSPLSAADQRNSPASPLE